MNHSHHLIITSKSHNNENKVLSQGIYVKCSFSVVFTINYIQLNVCIKADTMGSSRAWQRSLLHVTNTGLWVGNQKKVLELFLSEAECVYRMDDSDHEEDWARRGTKRKREIRRGRGKMGGRGRKKQQPSERSDGRELRLR